MWRRGSTSRAARPPFCRRVSASTPRWVSWIRAPMPWASRSTPACQSETAPSPAPTTPRRADPVRGALADRTLRPALARGARADGRGNRSPVPTAVPRPRRRPGGVRDDHLGHAAVAHVQIAPAHGPRGRTRADFYAGSAEYDTIRAIKSQLRIPVFANGDIAAPQKAREVLDFTGADGVMIGRASHGAPWIFRAVNAHLNSHLNERNAPPPLQRADLRDIILAHLESLYSFYGEESGVRIARKHLGWYCELLDEPAQIRGELMGAANTVVQFAQALKHFEHWVGAAAAAA